MGKRYHYKLIHELGRGSAGVIHLALDVEEQTLVALKVLSPEAIARHHNAIARFVREVKILERLDHPNLVRVMRSGRSRGRPYFAMEFVDGESLSVRLSKGPLGVRQSLKLAEQLASALDHVHQAGIVHRDLKPSNILLQKDLTPRLADFGLAHDESERDLRLTASGVAVGTLRYSSPEQCGGDSHKVDGRADLYSLGLVLAAAITGKQPRAPESMQDLAGRFDREYARMMARQLVPESVVKVCRKATRNDPRKRYQTAGAFAADLRRCLSENPSKRLAAAS